MRVLWLGLLPLAALAACPAPNTSRPPAVTITPPIVPPDAAVATTPPVPPGLEPPQPELRLPKNFVATGYQASLTVDPAKTTFDGTVAITGTVSESSSVIWLHARKLRITHAQASHGDPYATPGPESRALSATPRGEDLLELRADVPLGAGTWRIVLEYEGDFDERDTVGAFKETVAGKPYVFTQLESIYARRVFPCIDEPDSKVPWQLSLTVPEGMVATSNTPIASETPMVGGSKMVEFAPTKPLPSYLVAFAVGPFEIVDAGKTKSGTPVRVVTLAGRSADAAFAAKSTPHLLELLEDWFGIPYPYAKLDLVTVPLTSGFSAMENAGMVTFGERLMLFDQTRPSRVKQWNWVRTASHELSHQWFGDFVTTAWWDDIWLNEGFANWLETKIVAAYEPSWHAEQADVDARIQALDNDALASARAVRQPIASQSDIANAFDAITYDKGASVLRMFERYVGADVFQRGVRDYLQARAYGNATSSDFIAAIAAASGKDLAPAFTSLLERAGEPELEITTTCAGAAKVALSQHRYVEPGSTAPSVDQQSAPPSGGVARPGGAGAYEPWQLPVCVAYGSAGKRGEACTLLAQDTASVELPKSAGCPQWVLVNSHGSGYFRTAYTVAQVTALRDVAWPQLDESERRTLYFDVTGAPRYRPRGRTDTVAMTPVMKLPLPLALSFVPRQLAGGDRFTIGDAVTLPLTLDRFVDDDMRNKLEIWLRASYGAGATQLGVLPKTSDDLDVERERYDLFTLVAWFGRDPELVKQAVSLGDHWAELPQSVRGAILAVAVDASPELFARVLASVKTEPDRSKRDHMLVALGRVRDVERQRQALALLLDPSFDIREATTLLTSWSTEAARAEVEAFYRAHRAELEQRMPKDEVATGFGGVVDALISACDAHRRDDLARDLTALYAGRPGGPRDTQIAIERLDRCIASKAVLGPAVRSWLGGVKAKKVQGSASADRAAPSKGGAQLRDAKPVAKPAKPGHK